MIVFQKKLLIKLIFSFFEVDFVKIISAMSILLFISVRINEEREQNKNQRKQENKRIVENIDQKIVSKKHSKSEQKNKADDYVEMQKN